MKELTTRALSGLVYVGLLIAAFYTLNTLVIGVALLGLFSLFEFSRLINLKGKAQYVIFGILYTLFWYLCVFRETQNGGTEVTNILIVISSFVNLILIKDLFGERSIPLFKYKRYILSTFYLTSGFIFMMLIGYYNQNFSPLLLLGSFVLVWVNDSFAYILGKNFGRQKLFPSVSPKKTVEGFLGGLLFSCIGSYFIALYTETLSSTMWLILAIIISCLGTIGDLIESKFKRQANVKDSGALMPGHGGMLDRLDSIIFAAPFIYLFLRITTYVS